MYGSASEGKMNACVMQLNKIVNVSAQKLRL